MALRPRICCALLIGCWFAPAGAVSNGAPAFGHTLSESPAADIAVAEQRVSLDQAVAMVLRRYGGKVLSAETRARNGRVVHRIRVLTEDGRVRTVRVDGQTGRIS